MLLAPLAIGSAAVVLTVLFHVIGLVALSRLLPRFATTTTSGGRRPAHSATPVVSVAVLVILGLHTVESWGWALLYLAMGEFTELEHALYFSVVTSTTLGYGDLTLSLRWRLLSTFQAMGGLLLFGASTAFLLGVMQRLFKADSPGGP